MSIKLYVQSLDIKIRFARCKESLATKNHVSTSTIYWRRILKNNNILVGYFYFFTSEKKTMLHDQHVYLFEVNIALDNVLFLKLRQKFHFFLLCPLAFCFFEFSHSAVVSLALATVHFNAVPSTTKHNLVKKKVKQSRYTPWRRLGGEEV
jgi:hypothetical protein